MLSILGWLLENLMQNRLVKHFTRIIERLPEKEYPHLQLKKLVRAGQFLLPLSMLLMVCSLPQNAQAQYKNNSFGFNIAYPLLIKPAIVGDDGNIVPISRRPLRIKGVLEFTGDTASKLGSDRWWLTFRFKIGMYQHSNTSVEDLTTLSGRDNLTARYDNAARDALGTIMGIGGGMGLRYYVATDRIRPYMQGDLSYTRLLSFSSLRDNGCVDNVYCSGISSETNIQTFLPYPNIGGLGAQFGTEFILQRDLALNVFVRYDIWLPFTAPPTHGPAFGLGLNFFL